MARRGVRKGMWRYVPAGSSQNTTLNALSPPQRLWFSDNRRARSYARTQSLSDGEEISFR